MTLNSNPVDVMVKKKGGDPALIPFSVMLFDIYGKGMTTAFSSGCTRARTYSYSPCACAVSSAIDDTDGHAMMLTGEANIVLFGLTRRGVINRRRVGCS